MINLLAAAAIALTGGSLWEQHKAAKDAKRSVKKDEKRRNNDLMREIELSKQKDTKRTAKVKLGSTDTSLSVGSSPSPLTPGASSFLGGL